MKCLAAVHFVLSNWHQSRLFRERRVAGDPRSAVLFVLSMRHTLLLFDRTTMTTIAANPRVAVVLVFSTSYHFVPDHGALVLF
jgi:hypothetical protein